MEVKMILAVIQLIISGWKRTWKRSGLTGIVSWPLRQPNAPIKLIKPTGEHAIVIYSTARIISTFMSLSAVQIMCHVIYFYLGINIMIYFIF